MRAKGLGICLGWGWVGRRERVWMGLWWLEYGVEEEWLKDRSRYEFSDG